jgi:hypothetical protein
MNIGQNTRATPNARKLSDRLRELACAGTETERAGDVRGGAPAGAQVVAGGVTGAAPAAVELPKTSTPEGEAVRCSALLGRLGLLTELAILELPVPDGQIDETW